MHTPITFSNAIPVPPGSLVILRGDIDVDDEINTADVLARELAKAVGHQEFVVLHLTEPDSLVDVVSDPELVERLRAHIAGLEAK